jgi:hypothetical protein
MRAHFHIRRNVLLCVSRTAESPQPRFDVSSRLVDARESLTLQRKQRRAIVREKLCECVEAVVDAKKKTLREVARQPPSDGM